MSRTTTRSSRRSFLKTSAGAALVGAAAQKMSAQTLGANERLGVGFIGGGAWFIYKGLRQRGVL